MSLATYEEILDLPNHPEKLLVDLRDAESRTQTGHIPTSINIPFATLEESLKLSSEEFKAKFGRDKPERDTEIIFHCGKGGRAQKATDALTALGYTKARNYKGSWCEWSAKQGLN